MAASISSVKTMIQSHSILLMLLLCSCYFNGSECGSNKFLSEKIVSKRVTVEVGTRTTVGRVSNMFLCATLDWWPAEKCDYGTCSWKHASLLDLNINHPLLEEAVKALSPLTLRLGGSLQDRVFYKVGDIKKPCSSFVKQSGIFGFSEGCLNMSRWEALNKFFQKTEASVAFGLNALYGRQRVGKGLYSGAWDPSNARDLIKYSIDNKFQIQAWELGNEISANGVGTTIGSKQYAADVKALRKIVNELYADTSKKPLVVAPDGFFVASWYQQLLQETGPQVLDACTRHIYNLGAGVDQHLVQKILNPSYLSREAGAFKQMRDTLSRYGPWAQAWIGEAGGAYNSGQHLVNDAFISSFWYLDQLGMAASHNTAVYCRQSLVGGNYALLRTDTFQPNPDYYSALLWKKVMGADVLPATVANETYLRAYAHCYKQSSDGGLAVLLINLSNSTIYNVDLDLTVTSGFAEQPELNSKSKQQPPRYEYHLSASETNLHSQVMLINGKVLSVSNGKIPDMTPVSVNPLQSITVHPLTIAFAVLPEAAVPACIITS